MAHRPFRRLSFEPLETRAVPANLTAQIIDGDLVLRGGDEADRVRLDAKWLQPGEVRLTPAPLSTVNGESLPVVLRGWQGNVRAALGAGHDRIHLDRLQIAGSLQVLAGWGNDVILVDRSEIAGGTILAAGLGHDSVHLVQSNFAGSARVHTGEGPDVVALSNSRFAAAVDVRTAAGNDTILLRSSIAGPLTVLPGPGRNSISQKSVTARHDFREGAQLWQAGFADYPAGEEEFFELESGIRPLPPEVGISGTGFFVSGNNHSDDLFMFLKRRMSAAEGIVAGQTYQVRLRVVVASNAPSGAVGIGGAPGESVFLKAGASTIEPTATAIDGFVQMNVDKGNQAVGGEAASIVGDIANGRQVSGSRDPYVSLVRTHVHEFQTTASDAGELWLLVGTDSGFEGTTSLYYQRIEVELIPVVTGQAKA